MKCRSRYRARLSTAPRKTSALLLRMRLRTRFFRGPCPRLCSDEWRGRRPCSSGVNSPVKPSMPSLTSLRAATWTTRPPRVEATFTSACWLARSARLLERPSRATAELPRAVRCELIPAASRPRALRLVHRSHPSRRNRPSHRSHRLLHSRRANRKSTRPSVRRSPSSWGT